MRQGLGPLKFKELLPFKNCFLKRGVQGYVIIDSSRVFETFSHDLFASSCIKCLKERAK